MTNIDFIRIILAFIVIVWIASASFPYKLSVLEKAPGSSYDTFINSQEYMLEKRIAQLKKDKSTPLETITDLKEQLAHAYWSCRKFDDAINLYQEVKRYHEKLSKGYSQKLIDTMISLAGIYRDVDRLDDSIDYYEKIWQLDKAHLPANDIRLARDQTSMAVIAYVCGEIQKTNKELEKFMNNCLAHINTAQSILQQQPTPQTARLANLLYLKHLAFRSLGQKTASKECYKAADYLTKKMKRPYIVPWT